MSASGKRDRLTWLLPFQRGTAPEHAPLPLSADPAAIVSVSLRGGLSVVVAGGTEHQLSAPFGLPQVRDRLILQIDDQSGHLRRSWFVDDPERGEGTEADGAVISEGLSLIAALPGGAVRQWRLEDGAPEEPTLPSLERGPFLVAPGGALALCGRAVRDLSDGTQVITLPEGAQCATWDPMGGFLMVGDADGVAFWAVEHGVRLLALPVDGGVRAMGWAPDGALLAVGEGGCWRFGP